MSNTDTDAPKAAPIEISRAEARKRIFAAHKRKVREVEFFGATIELRQPTLGDVIAAQQDEDRESAIIRTLIKYAYIPRTEEKVFEDADADSFKSMPFGAEFLAVSKALEELSEVNFLDKKTD